MSHKKPLFEKRRLYPLLVIGLLIAGGMIRKNMLSGSAENSWVELAGRTMGTTYSVKYSAPGGEDYQQAIDSVLRLVNASVSPYIYDSEISEFNRNGKVRLKLPYFKPIFEASKNIYRETGGAFNPTVMSLVQAWGFGPKQKQHMDRAKVDSLLRLVNFDAVRLSGKEVSTSVPHVQLDFGAIAKGYGIDVVVKLLQEKGARDLMVEIGGEVVCKGRNAHGKAWQIGINDPEAGMEQRAAASLSLTNEALATSGNYRNYYEENGVKYAHTISPFTGYPKMQTLLSASVVAPDCMTADAYATAFMVLGLEGAKKVLAKHPELGACLIFSGANGEVTTFVTDNLKERLRKY